MENLPPIIPQIGFIAITVVMYTWVFSELKKAISKTNWEDRRKNRIYSRTLFVVLAWTVVISTLALIGFIKDFSTFPPRFMIVLIVPLISIVVVTFSASLKDLLQQVPAKTLIRLQVFRVFVEILLWLMFLQTAIPVQMTFEGRNFDVLAGLTALPAAYLLAKSRAGLVIWNILCLGLLANIVGTAVLSMPTPFRVFMNEPAGTILAHFPYVWLPGLLVPLAYGLHFFSLKQLSLKNR